MKHTIKLISDTQRLLSVTLDASDLQLAKQQALVSLAKNIKVAGFRPGKVPTKVAEKQLDPNVLNNEVLEAAINTSANDIITAENIMPLDKPKVEAKKFVPDQLLEYTAEFEVIPAIKLGDYKKLKLTKIDAEVTAKDISEVLGRMQQGAAEKTVVERAAKNGDELTIDFAGKDKDDKIIEGTTGKDYALVLGSGSFIPGFEEGLIGKKTGEKIDLPVTFPKDYAHKPLAGAKVKFEVTIHKVSESALPKLDDEFAKKSGAFATITELKADIKKELTAQKQHEAAEKQKDSLLEQLVKASKVPTPEILVQDQMQSLERDFTQNLLYRGQTLDQYLQQLGIKKEAWQKGELREQAVRRVQVGLVLSELSKLEKIDVTHEELEKRLGDLLAGYGKDPNIAKQLDTPEARRDIANRVMTEKTLDKLVQLNTK